MSIYVDITKKLGNFYLESQLEVGKEKLGILGSSGCGKSMTLKCIAGIITPDKGEIILNDKILFSSKKNINLIPQERNTGLMFQNYALFPNMTVSQNISLGITNKTSIEKKHIVKSYLELLKLQDLENRYPSQLSGGQQQRVALARIMAKSPDILMLDEPFSALDEHLRFSIENEFSEALNKFNNTVIYVSHSIDEVYKFCDSTAIMHNGKIIEKNTTKNAFKNPTTLEGAKLTGCKNISRINKIDQNSILALDWGLTFNINNTVHDDIKYMAFRETDISISNSPKHKDSFELSVAEIKESPFYTTLELLPTKTTNIDSSRIICKYSKDETNNIINMQNSGELYGSIKNENILLLK